MLRWLFRLLGAYYTGRAATRGPRSLGSYLVRRQLRRQTNRALRRWVR